MIKWSTFLADDQGVVDMTRVRAAAGVALALLAGAVTVTVVLVELVSPTKTVNPTVFGIMVTALVLPLTGGKIADIVTANRGTA